MGYDRFLAKIITLATLLGIVAASRYRPCSEGCCEGEFCAYDLMCYPVTDCLAGCPDGECINMNDARKRQVCVPFSPCHSIEECKKGHVCAPDFNLGYKTCQFDFARASCNMNIGKGDSLEKRGFMARWRGKSAYRTNNVFGGKGRK